MKKKVRRTRRTMQKDIPRCGLCGKTKNLIKTECCHNWICDDQDNYVLFSYARNSCSRNHDHYTLCAFHFNEGHEGAWQDCQICKDAFEIEMYVYSGTNEYNFEKLKNPPTYEPTRCSGCNKIIVLGDGGYSVHGKEYFCYDCSNKEIKNQLKRIK